MRYLVAFVGALACSLLLTPAVRALAVRVGAMDEPGEGKVHEKPVPYLGGVSVYLALLVGAALGGAVGRAWGLLSAGASVLVLGLYDDLRGCPPKVKLFLLFVVSTVVVLAGLRPQTIRNPFGGILDLGDMAWPLAVLWLVSSSSSLNLVDGLDGLAGGVVSVASGFTWACALVWGGKVPASLAAALAGASLGFLRYNFPPARIFMGDAGALSSGFVLGGIWLMVGPEGSSGLPVGVVVLGLPMVDILAAVLRRSTSGRSVFSPDLEHVHHRLLRAGLSPRGAVLFLYAVCIFLGIYGLVAARLGSGPMEAMGPVGVISAAALLSVRRRDV